MLSISEVREIEHERYLAKLGKVKEYMPTEEQLKEYEMKRYRYRDAKPEPTTPKQPLQETLKGKDMLKDVKPSEAYTKIFDVIGRCSLCNGRVVKQLEDGAVPYCEKCGATCKPEDLMPVIPMRPTKKFLRETTYPFPAVVPPIYDPPIIPYFPPYIPEPIYPWRNPYDVGDLTYVPPYYYPRVIC